MDGCPSHSSKKMTFSSNCRQQMGIFQQYLCHNTSQNGVREQLRNFPDSRRTLTIRYCIKNATILWFEDTYKPTNLL